jgi:hypothetical protein
MRTDQDALDAASRSLRAAAELLESMADRGEPAVRALLDEADAVEAHVEASLSSAYLADSR